MYCLHYSQSSRTHRCVTRQILNFSLEWVILHENSSGKTRSLLLVNLTVLAHKIGKPAYRFPNDPLTPAGDLHLISLNHTLKSQE